MVKSFTRINTATHQFIGNNSKGKSHGTPLSGQKRRHKKNEKIPFDSDAFTRTNGALQIVYSFIACWHKSVTSTWLRRLKKWFTKARKNYWSMTEIDMFI